jgi:poly(A) polymerase
MAEEIMTGLRYDNKTIETVREMVQHHMQFKDVPQMRPSTLKRMMARPTFPLELELHRIDCASSHGDLRHYDYLKERLETMSAEEIDPPPLISGHELLAMGLHPGREVGRIKEAIRVAQLEGTIQTQAEALALARKMAASDIAATGPIPDPRTPRS